MVVHVTVCAIQSRILGCPSIDIEDSRSTSCTAVAVLSQGARPSGLGILQLDCPDRRSQCWHQDLQCLVMGLLLWMWTICRIGWNRLMSLGRASSSCPFGGVLTFPPCPCSLGSPRRFMETIHRASQLSPARMDHHGYQVSQSHSYSGQTRRQGSRNLSLDT